jgi:hypothetical protein
MEPSETIYKQDNWLHVLRFFGGNHFHTGRHPRSARFVPKVTIKILKITERFITRKINNSGVPKRSLVYIQILAQEVQVTRNQTVTRKRQKITIRRKDLEFIPGCDIKEDFLTWMRNRTSKPFGSGNHES